MASLEFDEDLRRIYEVPTDPQNTVDGSGYKIYTSLGLNELNVRFTATFCWSRWVDFHNTNKWSTEAFSKSGGALRGQNDLGDDIFATFDLRLTNDWLFVPANYPHNLFLDGNIFPNLLSGEDADYNRVSAAGVSFRINSSDSLQVVRQASVAGPLTTIQEEALYGARDHARAANSQTQPT